jgi:hypothetical protein
MSRLKDPLMVFQTSIVLRKKERNVNKQDKNINEKEVN